MACELCSEQQRASLLQYGNPQVTTYRMFPTAALLPLNISDGYGSIAQVGGGIAWPGPRPDRWGLLSDEATIYETAGLSSPSMVLAGSGIGGAVAGGGGMAFPRAGPSAFADDVTGLVPVGVAAAGGFIGYKVYSKAPMVGLALGAVLGYVLGKALK